MKASIAGETPNTRYANKGKDKIHSKQSDKNRQEFTTLDSRGQNAEKDNVNLVYPYQQLKPLMNLKKILSSCKNYVREARGFWRTLKLSQTKDDVQQSTQSAFTTVRSQGKCWPRLYFSKVMTNQILDKIWVGFFHKIEEIIQGKAKKHPKPKQKCPSQKIRDQIEMNVHITCRVQAEELAKEQCQSFQTDRKVGQSS